MNERKNSRRDRGIAFDTNAPALEMSGLSVDFAVDGYWVPAAKNVTYTIPQGKVVAVVGESGSGKSVSSMAILDLLPKTARVSGSIKLSGVELLGMPAREMRELRGNRVAAIFQEPMTALNPVLTVGFQLVEALRAHTDISPSAARVRSLELLAMVELPDPEKAFRSYPHQLSGGQRQRVMIAQALSLDPALLIADEPTTALDVTVQAEILELMRSLRDRLGSAVLLITHDMGVVADIADWIVVMEKGEIVEQGDTESIFARPQHPYTRALLDAVPKLGEGGDGADVIDVTATLATVTTAGDEELDARVAENVTLAEEAGREADERRAELPVVLDLDAVSIEYNVGRGKTFRAVDEVSFTIRKGEVLGLVGESGSGKSTIGRAAIGLQPIAGGRLTVADLDISVLDRKLAATLMRRVGIVFQDPSSSLNPRLPVGESIGEPMLMSAKFLRKHGAKLKAAELAQADADGLGSAEKDAISERWDDLRRTADPKTVGTRVEGLLDSVRLPRSYRNRYPHELSGGQKQRIGIARALSMDPRLLVADEPTSALDVSVQATVLELLKGLQEELGFACLFITHDLAVVDIMAQRIAVLQHGKLVEIGDRDAILRAPQDPYTQRLIAAIPVPDPERQRARREMRLQIMAAGRGES